jgi:hypothetical protein
MGKQLSAKRFERVNRRIETTQELALLPRHRAGEKLVQRDIQRLRDQQIRRGALDQAAVFPLTVSADRNADPLRDFAIGELPLFSDSFKTLMETFLIRFSHARIFNTAHRFSTLL